MYHLNGGVVGQSHVYADNVKSNGFKVSIVEQINDQILDHQSSNLYKTIAEILKQKDKKWYTKADSNSNKYFVLGQAFNTAMGEDINQTVSTKATFAIGVNIFLKSSDAHKFAEKFEKDHADDTECKTEITKLSAEDYRKLVRSVTEEVLICQ